MHVTQAVSPMDLNIDLAKTMLDSTNAQDPTDITTDPVGAIKNDVYIDSADLTQILRSFVGLNIYQNIIGKNEVRGIRRRVQRGRPLKNSDEPNTKPSGRPSVYKITQEVERLQVLMLKPAARNRIRKAVIESGLVYKYLKHLLQMLYYAARQDKSVADKLFRAFASEDIAKNPEIKESFEKFLELDESKLDVVSDEIARISADKYLRYDGFIFLGGVFDMISKTTKNFI